MTHQHVDEAKLATWYRQQGLPTFIPKGWAGRDLLGRATPLMAPLALMPTTDNSAFWLLTRLPIDNFNELIALSYVVISFLVAVLVPVTVALGARALLRRTPTRSRQAVALGVVVVAIVAAVLLEQLDRDEPHVLEPLLWAIGLALAGLIAVRSGLGALISWALHSVLAHLRGAKNLASTAVPVIFTLVIFAFFSAETWQLTDTMRWPRIFFFGAVIAVVAALFITPVVVRDIANTREATTVIHRARLLRETPLHRLAVPSMGAMRPLSPLQRLNVVTVLTLTNLLLATVFAVVQWILLLVIGQVALTDDTLKSWLTHPPVPAKLAEVALPYSSNLLKAAAFLSLISALLFVISTVTDSENRARFLDPVFVNVRRALVVHDTYQQRFGAEPAAPTAPDQ